MTIALTTIKPENLIAKHSSGAIASFTTVKDMGGGQWSYTLKRDWVSSDTGIWEIWSTDTHKVLDENGNGIEARKITEIQVDIVQTAQYVIVVPWEALTTIAELKQADEKRLVSVVKNHHPTDAETDGSWGIWKSQIVKNQDVEVNFFLWIGGQYSYKLIPQDIVLKWEDIATYDPARKT
ncbi:MAG: hypothetical protein ACRCVT_10530, partial [Leadbetterella sp.]